MDEEEIVERCRAGDLEAYRMIYVRYEQPLLRTAYRMLGRQEEAEDAVQEAFLRLYRGIAGFRRGARLSTYLFRILMNACYDILRKRRKVDFEDFDPAILPADPAHELRHFLADAVDRLPRRMKACFVLFAVEEFTHEEIARIMDLSLGSVKVNIHRAKKKLRTLLGETVREEDAHGVR